MLRVRSIRNGRWLAALIASALICGTGPSFAQEALSGGRYQGDESCPSGADFWQLVREKLPDSALDAEHALPQLNVGLRATNSGYVGYLALLRADGTRYERQVEGPSCNEVARALAFVLALALGAQEAASEPQGVAAASETTIVAAGTTASAPPVTAHSAVRAPPPLARTLPPAPARRPDKTRPAGAEPDWRWAAGVQLGVRAGLAPESALLEGVFIEADQARRAGFALSARAAFLNAPTIHHTSANGSTDFRWWAGRLELCPLHWRLLDDLSLAPCLGAHFGRLRVVGHPLGPASTGGASTRLWAEAVGALRLELKLARWLSLQAQGDALLPLTRDLYAFDSPDTHVYQVPRLASAALLGLAGRCP